MSTRLDEAHAELEAARRARRETSPDLFSQAVERVADNAGPVWRERALEAVRHTALNQPHLAVTDVWRRMPDTPVYDGRAIGLIMKRARQLGWITPSGQYRPSPVPEHLGRPLLIWRSNIQGDQ